MRTLEYQMKIQDKLKKQLDRAKKAVDKQRSLLMNPLDKILSMLVKHQEIPHLMRMRLSELKMRLIGETPSLQMKLQDKQLLIQMKPVDNLHSQQMK